MIQERAPFSAKVGGARAMAAGAALGAAALRLHAAADVEMTQWIPAVAAAAVIGVATGAVCALLLPRALRRSLPAAALLAAYLVGGWDLRLFDSGVAFSPFFALSLTGAAAPGQVQTLRSAAGPAAGAGALLPATRLRYVSVAALWSGRGPGSVVLRDSAGRTEERFGGRLVADGRAHRLNFRAPPGPFRVVAQGPVEVRSVTAFGLLARGADKVIHLWWLWAGGAAALAVIGAVSLARSRPAAQWTPSQGRILAATALVAYVGLLCPHLDLYAGGADSSGYLNSAELLRHGHLTHAMRRPADAGGLEQTRLVPLGFTVQAGHADRLAPTYPPGLPLLFCLGLCVLPAGAAIAGVILLHFAAGVVLMAVFARQLSFRPPEAFALAGLLALCPVYLFMGLQPMSDVPALVWVLAAAVAARSGRPLLCGAAFAVAVLVRPSNLLALPALLLLRRWTARELALCVLAAAPFAAAEAAYNRFLYGHALKTGYGDTAALFSRSWLAPTFRHYLHWFPALFTPLIVLALAAPFLTRLAPRLRWTLVLWALPFLLFYAAYFCTHETWWYLRFLLPSLPAWAAAAALALPARLSPRLRAGLALFAAAWLLAEDDRLAVLDSAEGNRAYQESSRWLAAHAPRDAVVLCNVTGGALLHDTPLTFAFVGSSADARAVAAYAAARHHALYADFFPFENAFLPADPAAGQWRPVQRFGAIVIWLWAPNNPPPSGRIGAYPKAS